MENNQILDSKTSEVNTATLSKNGLIDLKQARGWALFITILGFIGLGLMVIAAIVLSIIAGVGSSGLPGIGVGLLYLVIAGIYFIPLIYLLKFTQAADNTYSNKDPKGLDHVFKNLKGHFKSMGIIIICFVSLYIIIIIAFAGMGVTDLLR